MKKRNRAEQIVGLRRQADVDLGKGMTVPDVCRRLGISQQTYYRWRTKIKQHLFCNWRISEVGHLGFHVQVSTFGFPVVTDLGEDG
jgi:hypothetical protein